ncbi:MAG: A/G-specific adenine glycosylase [Spirochaetaceae bacterium]|jgi:A/G-specific adenine glycosylase|nr:A/G-specific adenine glycosylase [Spirochaetaceae bacterium]
METGKFRSVIRSHFRKHGRIFPWRENLDPWGILVSEFMLQQTQTERVIPYWTRWMKKWPCPGDLARASLEEVLREWSGLGYNRRAKHLKAAAECIYNEFDGRVPAAPEELKILSGVGNYSAGAIACFAYNYPALFIETNIRTVFIHFFFPERDPVSDSDIFPVLEKTLDRKNPRTWYWALMDYGAWLKKSTVNPGRKSSAYTRQSPFKGSLRQTRGKVLRALVSRGPLRADDLYHAAGTEKESLMKALDALKADQLVAEKEGLYSIP